MRPSGTYPEDHEKVCTIPQEAYPPFLMRAADDSCKAKGAPSRLQVGAVVRPR